MIVNSSRRSVCSSNIVPPVTLVPGLERGYDVPEGGGDVAPAAGPLHIVNRRLGVHLNTD